MYESTVWTTRLRKENKSPPACFSLPSLQTQFTAGGLVAFCFIEQPKRSRVPASWAVVPHTHPTQICPSFTVTRQLLGTCNSMPSTIWLDKYKSSVSEMTAIPIKSDKCLKKHSSLLTAGSAFLAAVLDHCSSVSAATPTYSL